MKKNKKIFALALSAIIILIAFFSFSSYVKSKTMEVVKIPGGTIREGVVGTPRFINPVLARPENPAEQDLTELVYSRLISHDEKGNIHYYLAKNIEKSEDEKTYTLTLNDNIYFQDGKAITADDVVFTIEKIQDPEIKSPYQNRWDGIKAKKINDKKIEFDLVQPYGDFPYYLEIGVLPKHVWKDKKADEFIFDSLNEKPIGSGDYYIDNIIYKDKKFPEEFILKREKKSPGYIRNISLKLFGNYGDLIQAVKNGNIDAVYNPDRKDISKLKNKNIYTGKLPKIFGLFFNEAKNTNKNLRKAINSFIERDKLVKDVFSRYAYPINTITGNLIEKDGVKGDALLEKDGWKKDNTGFYKKDEKYLSLNISTLNSRDLLKTADSIKKQLQSKGIKVDIQQYELSDFQQKVIRQRDFDVLLYGYIYEKPSDLYALFHSSQRESPGINISMYKNPKIDTLLDSIRKYGDDGKRLKEIQNIIQSDIPVIPLYSPAYIYVLPREVKGVSLSIRKRSDRFLSLKDWYIKTRHVWNLFVKNTNNK